MVRTVQFYCTFRLVANVFFDLALDLLSGQFRKRFWYTIYSFILFMMWIDFTCMSMFPSFPLDHFELPISSPYSFLHSRSHKPAGQLPAPQANQYTARKGSTVQSGRTHFSHPNAPSRSVGGISNETCSLLPPLPSSLSTVATGNGQLQQLLPFHTVLHHFHVRCGHCVLHLHCVLQRGQTWQCLPILHIHTDQSQYVSTASGVELCPFGGHSSFHYDDQSKLASLLVLLQVAVHEEHFGKLQRLLNGF